MDYCLLFIQLLVLNTLSIVLSSNTDFDLICDYFPRGKPSDSINQTGNTRQKKKERKEEKKEKKKKEKKRKRKRKNKISKVSVKRYNWSTSQILFIRFSKKKKKMPV